MKILYGNGLGTVLFLLKVQGVSLESRGFEGVAPPLVKINTIEQILKPYLTEYQWNTSFTPVPKRAMSRYIFRSWLIDRPDCGSFHCFFKVWGLLSLIFLGLFTFWGLLKYKDAGWSLDQQQLNLRYRTIVRTTVFIKKNKIQSLEYERKLFSKKERTGYLRGFCESWFRRFSGVALSIWNKMM